MRQSMSPMLLYTQVDQVALDVIRRRERDREGGLSAMIGSGVEGLMAAWGKVGPSKGGVKQTQAQ